VTAPRAESVGTAWLIVALFVLSNIAIALLTSPGANLREAADGNSWFDPAVALLQHGAFVDPIDPTQPQVYRPPLFLIFAATALWFAGTLQPLSIVVAQVIVLLGTGCVVRRIAEDWLPGWGNVALALTLFNPNALSTAHLIQSDTLFAFLITLTLWMMLAYARQRQLPYALLAGGFLGLACLVRPTSQFLVLALPLVFAAIAALAWERRAARRGFMAGLAGATLAIALMLPWALHLAAAGQGLSLTMPEIRYRFVWDQVQMIHSQYYGIGYREAGQQLEGPSGPIAAYIAAQRGTWADLAEPERWRRLTDVGYRQLFDYPFTAHLKTGLRSLLQFLFAPGAGNWHGLLGLGAGEMSQAWFVTDQSDPFAVFRGFFSRAPLSAILVSALSLAIILGLRILQAVGIVDTARRHEWVLLFVLICLIAYFTLVHVYVGNSRYRLVVDPALNLLAVAGLRTLFARITRSDRKYA
jgi:4-amino-4-deoxy-L-arabinose transferase-like glycosyltransferase